ncbi:MAG: hypothetical protein J6S58_01385, partial [Lentisphaeria bacterium]|nr:hypothetical protein [Lentisphaeria bacterium]
YAPLVKEAGGIVLSEPFRQEELDETLHSILSHEESLKILRERGVSYGKSKALSFHNRAQRAADIMEALVRHV